MLNMKGIVFCIWVNPQHSQVGVEFVASIDQAANLVVSKAVFWDLGTSLLENWVLIFADTEADVVLKVCNKFATAHTFILKEFWILLHDASNHGHGVGVGIHVASLIKILSIRIFRVWFEFLSICLTGNSFIWMGECLLIGASFRNTAPCFGRGVAHFVYVSISKN